MTIIATTRLPGSRLLARRQPLVQLKNLFVIVGGRLFTVICLQKFDINIPIVEVSILSLTGDLPGSSWLYLFTTRANLRLVWRARGVQPLVLRQERQSDEGGVQSPATGDAIVQMSFLWASIAPIRIAGAHVQCYGPLFALPRARYARASFGVVPIPFSPSAVRLARTKKGTTTWAHDLRSPRILLVYRSRSRSGPGPTRVRAQRGASHNLMFRRMALKTFSDQSPPACRARPPHAACRVRKHLVRWSARPPEVSENLGAALRPRAQRAWAPQHPWLGEFWPGCHEAEACGAVYRYSGRLHQNFLIFGAQPLSHFRDFIVILISYQLSNVDAWPAAAVPRREAVTIGCKM